ncbi:penicillin-binding protein 2, partial [Streptococcus pyogenes]
ATEMKSIAQKLVEFVAVSEVNVSRRDKADYYLADSTVYSEVVKALPREQRFDTDGNLLPEATVYSNAVDSLKEEQLQFSE